MGTCNLLLLTEEHCFKYIILIFYRQDILSTLVWRNISTAKPWATSRLSHFWSSLPFYHWWMKQTQGIWEGDQKIITAKNPSTSFTSPITSELLKSKKNRQPARRSWIRENFVLTTLTSTEMKAKFICHRWVREVLLHGFNFSVSTTQGSKRKFTGFAALVNIVSHVAVTADSNKIP